MSFDPDTTRIVRSWLDEGVTQLPDRVLDAVLDELPATRQRRGALWQTRRLLGIHKATTLGVAAVIVGIAFLNILVPLAGFEIGGPSVAEPPAPADSHRPLPSADVDLDAGTYAVEGPYPFSVTVDVPEGWSSCWWSDDEIGVCAPHSASPELPKGVALLNVDNVVRDPCESGQALLDPPIGPSVDDLVVAISSLRGFSATAATPVTVDGFSGKQFELTAPEGDGGCPPDGDRSFGTWSTPSRTNGVSAGEVNLVRILDVDGVRLVITAAYDPAIASAEEVAEVRRIFDSIRISQ